MKYLIVLVLLFGCDNIVESSQSELNKVTFKIIEQHQEAIDIHSEQLKLLHEYIDLKCSEASK